MAEWQTRRSQKPLRATSCGFDSHLRHQPSHGSTVLVGAWLSLVERSVRVAEVGGSNPLAPTNHPKKPVDICRQAFCCVRREQCRFARFGQRLRQRWQGPMHRSAHASRLAAMYYSIRVITYCLVGVRGRHPMGTRPPNCSLCGPARLCRAGPHKRSVIKRSEYKRSMRTKLFCSKMRIID